MSSSYSNYSSITDDYNLHGDIVHNMRQTAKEKSIPILTISQNNRSSENESQDQTNNSMGGSIKKIRYADLVPMIRQIQTLDLFDEGVKNDLKLNNSLNTKTNTNLMEDIIIFEVTVTKNKNGDRNLKRYHIFSKTNLRIYNDIATYLTDMKTCQTNTKKMKSEFAQLEFSDSSLDSELSFTDIL